MQDHSHFLIIVLKSLTRYVLVLPLLLISIYSFSQEVGEELPFKKKKRNKKYVLFPVIVKSPEYRWGGGAAGIYYFKLKKDSITRTSNIKVVSFFTLRKQLVVASEGYVYFPGEKFIFHYATSASHFPDKFWGVGNLTENSNEENYAISQFGAYPQLLREIRPHLFAGVGYEFHNVFQFQYNSNNGQSLFDQEDILGRYGSKISGSGVILSWDSRNNAFSPNKGFFIQYYINAYRNFLGSDYNFNIQNLDARKYFDLHHERVLAFQFNMIATNGQVPIRDLANIGTNSYMRGYYEGRYQDKDLVAFQTEYRTPVYKRWGVAIFTGAGKVGNKLRTALNFEKLKPSLGLGIRYAINREEKLNLRVDQGFGQKSQGSYINMGEAF